MLSERVGLLQDLSAEPVTARAAGRLNVAKRSATRHFGSMYATPVDVDLTMAESYSALS